MNYVDHALEFYNSLIKFDYKLLSEKSDFKFDKFIDFVSEEGSAAKLKYQYTKEIESIMKSKLSIFEDNTELLNELGKQSYYARSVGLFTVFFIMWAAHNKVKLSTEELSKLVEAIFAGTIGYRLYDAHYDDNLMGREVSIIGNYLIHAGEEILLRIFEPRQTLSIINKYFKLYSEVEYLEKKHRWQACPFNWDEVEKLGYKASPLLMITEILFDKANFNKEKIDSLVHGFLLIASALQITDDISDAIEDLSFGTETLVMAGFYEKFGTGGNINRDLIENFLDDKKLLKFYDTTQSHYERARKIFTDNDDDIFLLLLEILNYEFTSEFVKGED